MARKLVLGNCSLVHIFLAQSPPISSLMYFFLRRSWVQSCFKRSLKFLPYIFHGQICVNNVLIYICWDNGTGNNRVIHVFAVLRKPCRANLLIKYKPEADLGLLQHPRWSAL